VRFSLYAFDWNDSLRIVCLNTVGQTDEKNLLAKLSSIEDEELVRLQLETGKTLYFEQIYRRYFKKVYYQVLSYLKDAEASQDLAQDIFVKLFDRLSKFRGKSTFSTWLFSFARNAFFDYLRKQGRAAIGHLGSDSSRWKVATHHDVCLRMANGWDRRSYGN